jgi:hypothetical protein
MSELGDICRSLVELADAAPPGQREQMFADLANLRRRLERLPGRVAEAAAMQRVVALADPMESTQTAGWFRGELQAPT